MALHLLDTDTLSLLRDGHPGVTGRLALQPVGQVATTVITVEEYLTGWYSFLRSSKKRE
jgi:predicted nucleic acid-binding protein